MTAPETTAPASARRPWWRGPSTTDWYRWAWRNVRHLPDPVVRAGANVAADVVWLRRGGPVRLLESNLSRLRPDLTPTQIRTTARASMRSYLRYFVEAFQLPGWSREQIDARVRGEGVEELRIALRSGSAVLALGHAGNWDLAGAWGARHIAPVLTVAEKLPDGLYEEFTSFRTGLGLTILPLEGGGTFRSLLRGARSKSYLACLLADRDLTASGVEVNLRGQPARVAAGPAALALAGGFTLFATSIRYERLDRERRKVARSPWGIVISFIPVPTGGDDGERRTVGDLTQAWVDTLFAEIAASPQDWHMLQRVFLADLDPDRLPPAAG